MLGNISDLKTRELFFSRTTSFAQYLSAHDPEELHPDSVINASFYAEQYSVINNRLIILFKTSAYEMLKNSGRMQLIKNKKLSQNIVQSYQLIEIATQFGNDYMSRKMDMIYKVLEENHMVMGEITSGNNLLDPRLRELYYFFAMPYNMEHIFGECIEKIEETLSWM